MHIAVPEMKKKVMKWGGIGAGVLFGFAMLYGYLGDAVTKKPPPRPLKPTELVLKMGERTPMVWVEPGKTFYIRANRPYHMVSFATRPPIRYEKPSGWSDVTGLAPAGCLFLEAIEERTVIHCIHRDETPNECIPLQKNKCAGVPLFAPRR